MKTSLSDSQISFAFGKLFLSGLNLGNVIYDRIYVFYCNLINGNWRDDERYVLFPHLKDSFNENY